MNPNFGLENFELTLLRALNKIRSFSASLDAFTEGSLVRDYTVGAYNFVTIRMMNMSLERLEKVKMWILRAPERIILALFPSGILEQEFFGKDYILGVYRFVETQFTQLNNCQRVKSFKLWFSETYSRFIFILSHFVILEDFSIKHFVLTVYNSLKLKIKNVNLDPLKTVLRILYKVFYFLYNIDVPRDESDICETDDEDEFLSNIAKDKELFDEYYPQIMDRRLMRKLKRCESDGSTLSEGPSASAPTSAVGVYNSLRSKFLNPNLARVENLKVRVLNVLRVRTRPSFLFEIFKMEFFGKTYIVGVYTYIASQVSKINNSERVKKFKIAFIAARDRYVPPCVLRVYNSLKSQIMGVNLETLKNLFHTLYDLEVPVDESEVCETDEEDEFLRKIKKDKDLYNKYYPEIMDRRLRRKLKRCEGDSDSD